MCSAAFEDHLKNVTYPTVWQQQAEGVGQGLSGAGQVGQVLMYNRVLNRLLTLLLYTTVHAAPASAGSCTCNNFLAAAHRRRLTSQ